MYKGTPCLESIWKLFTSSDKASTADPCVYNYYNYIYNSYSTSTSAPNIHITNSCGIL